MRSVNQNDMQYVSFTESEFEESIKKPSKRILLATNVLMSTELHIKDGPKSTVQPSGEVEESKEDSNRTFNHDGFIES